MSRRRPRVRALLAAAVLLGAPFGIPSADGDTVQEQIVGVFDLIEPQNFGARLAHDIVTLLIGAPDDTPGSGTPGVAYVFTLSSGGAAQQARLEPLDGEADDHFGCAVDASINLAAVGADREDENGQDAGAAYIFFRTGTSWADEEKITADDGDPQDRFGSAIAIDGTTVAIGAPGDDDRANNAGAVYVYTREAGPTWVLEQKITSVLPLANNGFGTAIALEGNLLVIGAPSENLGQFTGAGSVYVFSRSAGLWSQQTRLLPSNTQNNQAFGSSLALDGNDLVIGAPGSRQAYLFDRNGAAWSQPTEFAAGDGADESVSFGDSVALDGTRILVGDRGANVSGAASGQVHLFEIDDGVVEQKRLLRASTGVAGDGLGASVAMFGDSLFAGAPERGSGSLYRFGLDGAPDTVRSFIAPARVVVTLPAAARRGRKLGMIARGVLDTSSADVDLSLPGLLRIGTLSFPAPDGLTPPRRGRRAHTFNIAPGKFTLTPARNGSSRAIFTLNVPGDLTNEVVDEGEVPLRYTTSEFNAIGTVEVRNGAYRQRRIPGSVIAPVMDVRRVRATLRGAGRDAFTMVLGFDTNGQTAPTKPQMTVCLGTTFREELAPDLFKLHPRGDRHQVVRTGSGIYRAVVNYARGEITVKARNVNLGDFDDGPVRLFAFVRLDGRARSAEVRALRRRRALRY